MFRWQHLLHLLQLDPEKGQLEASRLFLAEVHEFINRRESLAFETTLSGRSHLRLIRKLVADGWIVQMFYLWLPSVEACRQRVAERVKHGGHSIPDDVIERRYFRSVRNLLFDYASDCSSCVCFRNWGDETIEIFHQNGNSRVVVDVDSFHQMTKAAE